MRGLDGVGAASVLGCVDAASALLGGDVEVSFGLGVRVVVGAGACVVGVVGVAVCIWFRMRPRSAMYHALSCSSLLWSMSAPPIRKAMLVFLFFTATFVRSRSSLMALFFISDDHRASVFSSRRTARAWASARQCSMGSCTRAVAASAFFPFFANLWPSGRPSDARSRRVRLVCLLGLVVGTSDFRPFLALVNALVNVEVLEVGVEVVAPIHGEHVHQLRGGTNSWRA